jgi:hypothetical protein
MIGPHRKYAMTTPPARAAHGTAMMEMCLVLPLLFLIISFLFYFGRGLMRVQFAQVADRYVAWEQESGRVPVVVGASGPALNDAFNDGAAASVAPTLDADSGAFPADATNTLTNDGSNFSNDAHDLIAQSITDFPKGVSASLQTTYTSSIRLWQALEKPILHGHIREGNDWKFVNQFPAGAPVNTPQLGSNLGPWMLQPATEKFFQDLDTQLKALGGNPVASYLVNVYSGQPGYRGPTVIGP